MNRQLPDCNVLHDIYIDESSQTKHRFLGLGGITLLTQNVSLFDEAIQSARLPELPHGELAWTKVSPGKLKAYERVIDAVLGPAKTAPNAEFHCVIVDTSRQRHNIFNSGSREVGFNKEIYQLCQKFGRLKRLGIFHVYLDQRHTRSSTQELRDILNHGIRARHPQRDWPFRRVHFRDSASCHCLQVVDILLGAVAFHVNGHRHRADASNAKCFLSDKILHLASVRDVMRDTTVTGNFTIWHRQLR